MAIDFDANVLAPMMGAGVFGEDIQPTYFPANAWVGDQLSFPIDGVFDNAYEGVTILSDGTPDMVTVNPVLGVRMSQFPAPPVAGDKVYIASVDQTYFVNTVRPDGHGWAKLELTLSA